MATLDEHWTIEHTLYMQIVIGDYFDNGDNDDDSDDGDGDGGDDDDDDKTTCRWWSPSLWLWQMMEKNRPLPPVL